jgi:hypothetical protein
MNVKYQIFVSSTYDDLRDERNEVIKACLNMGHIPVGMEMFNAADEEQWAVITRTIDQCDYYVVIIAHRYGSILDGISFTEREYDYAVQANIPVLGFVISETGVVWPPEWVDNEPRAAKALRRFKAKVKKKLIRPWQNRSELRAMFVESLTTAINLVPRRGWIRAPEHADSDVAQTLSNLAEENARLRRLVDESSRISAEEIADVTKILYELRLPSKAGQKSITFAEVYKDYVFPELLGDSGTDAKSLAQKSGIDPRHMETVISDLKFLKVIRDSEDEFYIITELGRRVLLRIAASA